MIDDDIIFMVNDAEPNIICILALAIGVELLFTVVATPVCLRWRLHSEESSINLILVFLNQFEHGFGLEEAIFFQVSMALICLAFHVLKFFSGTEGNKLLVNGVESLWNLFKASVWVMVFKLTALESCTTNISFGVLTTANANNVLAGWACTPFIIALHVRDLAVLMEVSIHVVAVALFPSIKVSVGLFFWELLSSHPSVSWA